MWARNVLAASHQTIGAVPTAFVRKGSRIPGANLTPIIFLVALLVQLAACAGSSVTRQRPADSGTVILVSIDGFRWDYLELYETPTLQALAHGGARAEALIPVFPTLTFPNHYTMVTGLYPAKHGVVGNRMYDPTTDRSFAYTRDEDVADSIWWGGEPIWVTAEKSGIRTATIFWVGSEAPIRSVRPSHWMRYDHDLPIEERVHKTLQLLDLPPPERPRFITMYFPHVDDASHRHGPATPEVGEAVRVVDDGLGLLLTGLRERDLMDSIDIIVASDHGQARRDSNRVIFLSDYIKPGDARFVERSPTHTLWPTGISADSLYEKLHGAHPHMQVYNERTMPAAWHYHGSPRVMPVVAVADKGWTFGRRDDDPRRHTGGDHGYDPSTTAMHGVFVAHGPSFRPGAVIPPIESVHLYELMADILKIRPVPNDGSLEATSAMRKFSPIEAHP